MKGKVTEQFKVNVLQQIKVVLCCWSAYISNTSLVDSIF